GAGRPELAAFAPNSHGAKSCVVFAISPPVQAENSTQRGGATWHARQCSSATSAALKWAKERARRCASTLRTRGAGRSKPISATTALGSCPARPWRDEAAGRNRRPPELTSESPATPGSRVSETSPLDPRRRLRCRPQAGGLCSHAV